MSKRQSIAAVVIALILLAGVYTAGWATAPVVQRAASETPTVDVQDQFKVFWEAWGIVDQHFVDEQALDVQKRTYGAIGGMLDSLGDLGHTRFLSAEELKEEREGLAGSFEGIGAEVGLREGRPVIIAPLDQSPAERAGILPGDVIVAVDGEDTGHMTLQQVIRRIRGPKGTSVTLTVIHRGETVTVDITVTREAIKVRIAIAHYLPEHQIGHVRITQFASTANSELVLALKDMQAKGARALVIDVRNDPGGLLDQAVLVASQFLKEGNVLLEQDRSGNRRPYPVQKGGVATDIPVAVLVNRGTASAAEIFAGAIKDNARGQVIGEPSFGTGTVLSTFPLSDGSALLLATAEWLTPNGSAIRNNGITPDVKVALDNGAMPVSSIDQEQISEDELLRRDAQLRAAVQALSQ